MESRIRGRSARRGSGGRAAALVAWLVPAMATAGCTRSEGVPEPAPGALLGGEGGHRIGASHVPFRYGLSNYSEAVRAYRGMADLFRLIPPSEARREINRVLEHLAEAIALAPANSPAALDDAANLIRQNRLDPTRSIPSPWETQQVKQALEVASGALRISARSTRAGAADVLASIRRLDDVIAAIDGSQRLDAQHEEIARALERTADVLQQIRAAAVRRP